MLIKKYPELNCDAQFMVDFITQSEADNLRLMLQNRFFLNQKFRESQPHHIRIPGIDKVMFMDEALFKTGALPNEHWGKTSAWFTDLEKAKQKVERLTNTAFHTCIALYYPNGHSWVDFHTDYPAFGTTEVIASLSLGVERSFLLRDKQSHKLFEERLSHGSLFVMGKGCQENYEHSLPQDFDCSEPRINLTFRTYGNDNRPEQRLT